MDTNASQRRKLFSSLNEMTDLVHHMAGEAPPTLNGGTNLVRALQKGNITIEVRESDGFINATKMANSGRKKWKHYNANADTQSFLKALGLVAGFPTSELVQSNKCSVSNAERGTWVHPQVAIDLARWISPEFSVAVTDLVLRYFKGEVTTEESKAANAALIEQLEKKLVTSLQEHTRVSRREHHHMLLEAFHSKNVVYVVLIEEVDGTFIVKVGQTTDIRERVREHGCTYGKHVALLFAFEANRNAELETCLFHLPIFIENRYDRAVNGKVSKEHFQARTEGAFTLEKLFDIIRREGRNFQHLDQDLYLRQQEINNQAAKLALERDALALRQQEVNLERERFELDKLRGGAQPDRILAEVLARLEDVTRSLTKLLEHGRPAPGSIEQVHVEAAPITLEATPNVKAAPNVQEPPIEAVLDTQEVPIEATPNVKATPDTQEVPVVATSHVKAACHTHEAPVEAAADIGVVPVEGDKCQDSIQVSNSITETPIETRSSPCGPYVQKLDRDTFSVVAVYDGITDAIRRDPSKSISIAAVKRAVQNSSVYNGHRWNFVERDKDPSVKYEIPATSTKVRYVVHGWVAQLNYMKTEITAVYQDQKTAAAVNGFKGRTAISVAVKKGNAAGRSYYVLWDSCAEQLKAGYISKHGPLDFVLPTVIDQYDMDGNLVASWHSKQEVVNKLAIGHNKLRMILDSEESYKGMIFKRTANHKLGGVKHAVEVGDDSCDEEDSQSE